MKAIIQLYSSIFCSILLAVFLFLSNTAYSKNYYVATTGNDSNNGTSISTPFLTISYAIGKVIAGDTIYVRTGTYNYATTIKISKNGTSTSGYYLFVYPGDNRPILDFSGMAVHNGNKGITLSGSYWYIKGIRIKGAGDNGLNISGNYNIVDFCDFYENHDAGCQLSGGAHDNRIINCDSYYNADYIAGSASSTGGNADGFSPKLDAGTNNYFYGCRSYLNSNDGFNGYVNPSDKVTTTFENCWAWKNGYLKDGVTTTSSMDGNGFKLGVSGVGVLKQDFILKNCLAFNNKGNGFNQNSNLGSATIYNGTSINNVKQNFYLNSSITTPSGSVFMVKNCVAVGSSGTSFSSGTILSNNQFNATPASFLSLDSTGVSEPRKADGSLPDITFMHLGKGSALIDAGTDVGLPYNGTNPDLGCFESGNSSVYYTLTTSVGNGSGNIFPSGSTTLLSSNSITITATPSSCYTFDKWTDRAGSNLSTSNPYTVSMSNGNLTVKANFILLPLYTLTTTVASGSGAISPVSGIMFCSGSSVILTATPSTGYAFDKWLNINDTTLSTSNPYTIVIGNSDLTVKANFVNTYTLTLNVASGSGSILPASGLQYKSGTSVILAATPATNFVFDKWTDVNGSTLSTSNPYTIVIDSSDLTVKANFIKMCTLTLNVASGSGTILPASGLQYKSGTSVILTATPATNYLFDKWTDVNGTTLSTSNPYTVVIDNSDLMVKANFISLPQYTLTTSISNGSGSITPASGTQYYSGTSVSLTATPFTNYMFVSWGDDAFGTSASTSIIMNANKNVSASFILVKRTLTLMVNPSSSGTISPASGSTYDHGTSIKLTGTPASGYVFDKWTNNSGTIVSTYDTLTVAMDADKTFTGNFKLNTGINSDNINNNDNFVVRYGIFNEIKIDFGLENSAQVAIYLYNMQGALISTNSTENYSSGNHFIDLTNKLLAPGIYVCKLMVNGNGIIRKIIIY